MKKMIFGAALLAVAGMMSCKKDDGGSGVSLPANGWIVDGNTYTVKQATCGNAEFFASDSFGSRATISFYGTPDKDKVYKIVGLDRMLSGLAEDEVLVGIGTRTGRYYYTSHAPNANVVLKMTNGKVNVTVPEVWLRSEDGDSVRFTANMAETR